MFAANRFKYGIFFDALTFRFVGIKRIKRYFNLFT